MDRSGAVRVSLCKALLSPGSDVTMSYRKTPMDYPDRTVEKEAHRAGFKCYDGFRLNRYFSSPTGNSMSVHQVYRDGKGRDRHRPHEPLPRPFHRPCLLRPFSGKRPLFGYGPTTRGTASSEPFHVPRLRPYRRPRDLQQEDHGARCHELPLPCGEDCVIPPGITPYGGPSRTGPALGIAPRELVIGVIGRLKPDRGYDVILEAFKIVREKWTR